MGIIRRHFIRIQILKFIITYLTFVTLYVIQKPFFMAIYCHNIASKLDWLRVPYHGLSMDFTMAGYLMIIPALLLIAEVWKEGNTTHHIRRIYNILASTIIIVTFFLNIILYKFWGFPLDSTPVFYFLSSPIDAIASVSIGVTIAGIIATIGMIYVTSNILQCVHKLLDIPAISSKKIAITTTIILTVMTAFLFIPIRGGITASTQNTGSAYFSNEMKLNHAAVNPTFSLLESITKDNDFANQYRFMDDKKAGEIVSGMISTSDKDTEMLLKEKRPDIYIIILESFSDAVMKTGVTPHLKALCHEGVYFENMYANSFRTDRGTLAILSGYPAQPTMSLMKYPKKTNKLPSIGKKLSQRGYNLRYFYGGDADFTNMRSYMVSMDFTDITSNTSFPINEQICKWGVPDHFLFQRVQQNLKAKDKKPRLWVIQTSSSHEPFDVPYHKLNDKVLNAFNYTDSCIGKFINKLKESDRWNRSLVILIPDHLGCFPENIDNFSISRYQIPMVWLGGAIKAPKQIKTYGSQQDIAATLLGQMGIAHHDMKFSKNMLSPQVPHFAFFTVPDAWGMNQNGNYLIFNNKNKKVVVSKGESKKLVQKGKAYLQKLYDDIAVR